MGSPRRALLGLAAITVSLGNASCVEARGPAAVQGVSGPDRASEASTTRSFSGGSEEPQAIPEPVSCPRGTVRVERVFRSAELAPKVVGLSESCERSDGVLHGPTADWHLIGRGGSSKLERVYQGQYREGREVGVWHQWHANGEKKSDRHYLLEGRLVAHIVRYPSGRLRAVYQYWRYERHGTEIYWEESGELSSVRVFDRGALVYTSEPTQSTHPKAHSHGVP